MVPECYVGFGVGTRKSTSVDGVVAQELIDPTWANSLLDKFRASYPMTRRHVQGCSARVG
jgi:hypothetical protein